MASEEQRQRLNQRLEELAQPLPDGVTDADVIQQSLRVYKLITDPEVEEARLGPDGTIVIHRGSISE